ncbi:phosphoglucosamine mutase [Hypericibacter adhaerens]|uniref:Phosphoglucosamine mutase n=1 Tax=Hypericibacter adhaerens TaxID=2602016 RepID=A0A5J6N5N6_9PROT|nr:phosphoglucosamine mutase [Hypericibacter adhaerens]QEX23983.1 phosphoglucosamine mutase [Hypericibacter adhaerens]
MTRKLFGTDGIRGKANAEPVTAMTALKLAMAAGAEFTRGDHRHRVVIGKDTRLSGYMLEPALTSGFVAMGMDVILLGPMPTPAIAMLTRSLRADLGVMISASHNPYEDNGIKLFGPDGYKLSDEVETRIEARMAAHETLQAAPSAELGRALRLDDARGRYMEAVKRSFPKSLNLDGLKIVVDCAHGAAYRVAPTVLWELGAEVVAIGDAPDGFNINRECGATAPAALQKRVIAEKADLGLALDGDADRLILVDEKGQIVDGDQIMALIARSWAERDRLQGGAVVATVMSNLGLERFLAGLKLKLLRTPVGDRYVVERMRAEGCNVGGEQSGHIILGDYGTTGDGLIAALQVLAVIVRAGRPVSETTRLFQPLPQLLKNLKFNGGQPLERDEVKAAIKGGETALGTNGRVLIRKSGTEPVIRIMAEGEDEALVGRVVEDIAQAIERAGK